MPQWTNSTHDLPMFQVLTRELVAVKEYVDEDEPVSLVVWNDEVNTFDWVILSLIDICGHTSQQAEQCAMIIHTKGKYCVKKGPRREVKTMWEALVDRGIGATVED